MTHRILPGGRIGILGGGQLGRMMAMPARTLGYDVDALDPDPDCPARGVVDRCITANFDDADAAADLAQRCDVVTLEIEQISLPSLEAAARFAPVRPGIGVMEIVQDRARQKHWLSAHGYPLGEYRTAGSPEELVRAAAEFADQAFVKACTGGYDGRSQVRVSGADDASAAWAALGGRFCVVERALDIEAELSVMVARRPDGQTTTYPPAVNHHEQRILDWSVIPGSLSPTVTANAVELGRSIAESLGVEGLLAVELFLIDGDRLLVNELAPRPHNTFHATEAACLTSQFEQAVRAVCNLPLGSVEVARPAAIVNLLGDLWADGAAPAFEAALQLEGVRLHLYGKRVARPGRKMGHLSAVGATPEEATRRALEARTLLRTLSRG